MATGLSQPPTRAPRARLRVLLRNPGEACIGDTDNEIDVYERSGSTTTWISFGPAGGNGDPSRHFHAFFAGASADGLKVYFETDEILTGDDDDPTFDVYQRQGGVTTRISTGPNGGNDEWDASYRGSIADGTKVWFQTNEPIVATDTDANFQDVYERSGGTTTTLLSTGPTDTNQSVDASFAGATLSGNRVFMTTRGETDVRRHRRQRARRLRAKRDHHDVDVDLGHRSSRCVQRVLRRLVNRRQPRLLPYGRQLAVHRHGPVDHRTVPGPERGPDGDGRCHGRHVHADLQQPDDGAASPSTLLRRRSKPRSRRLSNFAPGDVAVTGSASNYTVEFQGVYAATNVGQLVGNGANLTGGAATVDVGSQTQGSPAIPAQLIGQQDVYERFGTTTTHLSVGPTGGNDPDLDASLAGASPDGQKVFIHTSEALATEFDTDSQQDVYGALVASPFPRPGGGTPLRTPLMPAYKQCTSPNSQHVTPLAEFVLRPTRARVQHIDHGNHGQDDRYGPLDTVPGNTGTPADEADVRVNVSTTDVRKQADGTDYAGNLIFRLALRVSDRGTGTSEGLSGTVGDSDISLPINCTTTGDSTIGSSCSINTTIDTLVPNFAREGKRRSSRLARSRCWMPGSTARSRRLGQLPADLRLRRREDVRRVRRFHSVGSAATRLSRDIGRELSLQAGGSVASHNIRSERPDLYAPCTVTGIASHGDGTDSTQGSKAAPG